MQRKMRLRPLATLVISLGNMCATLTFATDSTDSKLPITTAPNAIVVMDKGWIPWPQSSTQQVQHLRTNTMCPTNFTPYIDLTFEKIRHTFDSGAASQGFMRAFGICVSKIDAYPDFNLYYVAFYIQKNYSDVLGADSYAYDYKNNTQPLYAGTSSGAAFLSAPIGYKRPNTPDNHTYDAIGGMNWTLYCYPKTLTPPYDQVSGSSDPCDVGNPPFANSGR